MRYKKLLCGRLYDGIRDEMQENREILIEDKTILEVGAHTATPQGCEVIDLTALTGGFTTIRHVGWFREDYSLDVRRAIDAGFIDGARMVVAPHFLCAPGSHGDSTQSIATNPALSCFMEQQYPTMGSGAEFFRDAVRHEVKIGADLF